MQGLLDSVDCNTVWADKGIQHSDTWDLTEIVGTLTERSECVATNLYACIVLSIDQKRGFISLARNVPYHVLPVGSLWEHIVVVTKKKKNVSEQALRLLHYTVTNPLSNHSPLFFTSLNCLQHSPPEIQRS